MKEVCRSCVHMGLESIVFVLAIAVDICAIIIALNKQHHCSGYTKYGYISADLWLLMSGVTQVLFIICGCIMVIIKNTSIKLVITRPLFILFTFGLVMYGIRLYINLNDCRRSNIGQIILWWCIVKVIFSIASVVINSKIKIMDTKIKTL